MTLEEALKASDGECASLKRYVHSRMFDLLVSSNPLGGDLYINVTCWNINTFQQLFFESIDKLEQFLKNMFDWYEKCDLLWIPY
jgi:hypothetical protein